MASPTTSELREAPKVLLHDHLDGGVRPATVIELAEQHGYGELPTHDADELATWMVRGASRLNLVLYLETFAHTVGVMQTADALHRVAAECAEDLADDTERFLYNNQVANGIPTRMAVLDMLVGE